MSGSRPLLLLASSSPARRELLGRLKLPFHSIAPQIDETPRAGETAPACAARLAEAKARALQAEAAATGALVIGSDQVAELGGRRLGKPGGHARAAEQLRAAAGRSIDFATAVCLLDPRGGRAETVVEPYRVTLRPLSDAEIERYLQRDRPYDCAASFKAEAFASTIIARHEGADPTALIGLPLIALCRLLAGQGVGLP